MTAIQDGASLDEVDAVGAAEWMARISAKVLLGHEKRGAVNNGESR
jgi:hypothetical protein